MTTKDIDGFFCQCDTIFGDTSPPNYSIYPGQKMARLLVFRVTLLLVVGQQLIFLSLPISITTLIPISKRLCIIATFLADPRSLNSI